MRVDRGFAAAVLDYFGRRPAAGFRIIALLSACLRYTILRYRVRGPGALAEEVRDAGKLPILEALAAQGWETLVPLQLNLGGLEIHDTIDGVKDDAVAAVAVGRPTSLVKRRLLAIMALRDASKGYLISVNPVMGTVTVLVLTPTQSQKKDIIEYLTHRAQIIKHYITREALPSPDEGPWCSSCPYREVCHALQRMRGVEVVPGV